MADTPVLRLVDTSAWQGTVEWAAVKASGVSGALCKIGEGVGDKDSAFDRTWPAIKEAGLVRGCYFFARQDLVQNTPEAEAEWFLSQLPPLEPGDLVAYDVEVGAGDLSGLSLRWLQHVERALGFKPLVYSYISFIRSHLQHPALAAYDLWLSAFGDVCPADCPPWPSVALWQFTDAAEVPGIAGRVDMSQIARDLAGLRALGKPAAAAPPQPPPAAGAHAHKVVITTTMLLRRDPHHDDIYDPTQLVYAKAVLDRTDAPETNGWIEVTAGKRRGWVLKSNTRPA